MVMRTKWRVVAVDSDGTLTLIPWVRVWGLLSTSVARSGTSYVAGLSIIQAMLRRGPQTHVTTAAWLISYTLLCAATEFSVFSSS